MDHVILTARYNDGNLWVEGYRGDALLVTALVKGEQALPSLVVPNLDEAVVRAGYKMRSLEVWAEVDAVYAGFVTLQGVVRG